MTAIDRQDDQVSFTVRHANTGTGDARTDVLYETWTVTVHKTPTAYFLFDIESVQECASDRPLTLNKYHYGGMALRGNSQWLKAKGDKTTNAGDLPRDDGEPCQLSCPIACAHPPDQAVFLFCANGRR